MGLKEDVQQAITGRNSAVRQLIAINVAAFALYWLVAILLFLFGQQQITELYIEPNLYLPANWQGALEKPWTLFTYFLMHKDPFHIFFNMVWLYWFGTLIEEYLGRIRLFNLFILGGLFGGIMYLLCYNFIPVFQPYAAKTVLLGASGGIYAVVLGAATLLPNYTFNLFLFGPVKITWIAAVYVMLSFISVVSVNAGGNLAHLGGALFGYLYIWQLQNGNDWGKPINYIRNTVKHILAPETKMEVTHKTSMRFSPKPVNSNGVPSEEEIDRILDKISHTGYESLSKEEKQKLFRAGQNN